MTRKKVKVFYSWQSDLPGNQTRYFIKDCIDQAVINLGEEVEAERDNDTEGLPGSPNIVTSIFEKIDNSDLFVADVSIVGSYKQQKDNGEIKYIVSPNVMLELGYAVNHLGWDHIVCLMNSKYGSPKQLPFDVYQQRVTPFSLPITLKDTRDKNLIEKNQKAKEKEKQRIVDILVENILNAADDSKHGRKGHSFHVLGGFDLKLNIFKEELVPLDISAHNMWVQKYVEQKKILAKELYEAIVDSPVGKTDHKDKADRSAAENGSVLPPETEERLRRTETIVGEAAKAVSQMSYSLYTEETVEISPEDKDYVIEKCGEYLGISELPDSFFSVGSLKRRKSNFPAIAGIGDNEEFNGTEFEKDKNEDLEVLEAEFYRIDLILELANGLSKYVFIPFVLKNSSDVPDENITIDIYIDENTSTCVNAETFFTNSRLVNLGGFLHDEAAVNGIFHLPQNTSITLGDYYPSKPIAQVPHIETVGGMLSSSYESTDDDFIDDLNDCIADPEDNHYALQLRSIRPTETVWLEKGILVKPVNGVNNIRIEYKITSNKLNESLKGELEYKVINNK